MDHFYETALTLWEGLDTPLSLKAAMLLKAGEWQQLFELRADPHAYDNSELFWRDNQAAEFLRKMELDLGDHHREELEQAAIRQFYACEAQCAKTNLRLLPYITDPLSEDCDPGVLSFIKRVRKEVAFCLGRVPSRIYPRFSGGSTMSDSGSETTIPDKLTSIPTHTQGFSIFTPYWMEWSSWGRLFGDGSREFPTVVRGNEFFTVAKDANKRRGCCKEPSLNVTHQLDVGNRIRGCLRRRFGVDLTSGQQYHQYLAKVASTTGEFATLDQSNASDTLSRGLVRLLLPEEWFTLLDSLRSHSTLVDGRWVHLEKFSSMGNGFTFELETLIFLCLARSACGLRRDWVTCYGDDLIVPSEDAEAVKAVLRFFGFTLNERKSFVSGHFRESCGGDFFDGVPVRAFYMKELPDEPQKWIGLANGIRRVASADTHIPLRRRRVYAAWLLALGAIPSHIRGCRGPEHLGDIVIHDDDWPSRAKIRYVPGRYARLKDGSLVPVTIGYEIPMVRAYMPVSRKRKLSRYTASVQMASVTLVESSGVTPRVLSSCSYKVGWVDPRPTPPDCFLRYSPR